ncbi:hypothetical protein CL622_02790, partial [archaeon]|nr:hypothetical protein [archaeon]
LDKQYHGAVITGRGDPSIQLEDSLENLQRAANAGYAFARSGGQWMYVTEDCELTFSYIDTENGRKMAAGWNFITFTPRLLEMPLKDAFGTCSVSKATAWSASDQKWHVPGAEREGGDYFSLETYAQLLSAHDEPLNEEPGITLVLKVDEDCELGSGPAISAPPALPE